MPDYGLPTEAFRKIFHPVDVIRPDQRHFLRENTVIEKQFNCKHDPLQSGQSVLIKDYRGVVEKWTQSHIVRRTEHVTYDMDVESSSWVQDENHLHHLRFPTTEFHDPVFLLDIIHFRNSSEFAT